MASATFGRAATSRSSLSSPARHQSRPAEPRSAMGRRRRHRREYGIGSALALDLTVHTDFSQVEADEQQINLTRFSLFFPEKREFFLENQGSFRIGDLAAGPLIPFFSRRIGLSSGGEPIPILGGARLTGRQGDYTLGLLNIQTERFDGQPADNFTTLRTARNFGGSSIGGFYLGREASGLSGHNRVAGGDVHLNRQTMDFFGFAMRSETTGAMAGNGGTRCVRCRRAGVFSGHRLYQHLASISQ